MKYSILYLNYDPEHKLCDMVKNSIHSIICNSVGHDYELIILDRKGLNEEMNRGFLQARGDYIIMCANDVYLEDNKWLDKIAIPGTITGWHSADGEFYKDAVDFSALFCIPRDVREKVGLIDTNFTGYGYNDDDYFFRAKKLGIPFIVTPIRLTHLQMQTFKAYNEDTASDLKRNREYFLKKHNL